MSKRSLYKYLSVQPRARAHCFCLSYQEFPTKALVYVLHNATFFLLDFGLRMPLSDLLGDARCAKVLAGLLTVLSCPYRQTLTESMSWSFISQAEITLFHHKGWLRK